MLFSIKWCAVVRRRRIRSSVIDSRDNTFIRYDAAVFVGLTKIILNRHGIFDEKTRSLEITARFPKSIIVLDSFTGGTT